MKKSDSELISAFLDNELSELELASFKKRLQEDVRFADDFTQYSENDLALKLQASVIDGTPVPESIMNLLAESEQKTQTSDSNIVQLASWKHPKWLSIAASFLIVTLVTPMLWYANTQNDQSLASVLSSEVSGQTVTLEAGKIVALVMSFKDRQGNFCREYRLSQADGSEQTIACNIDGTWQTQISDAILLDNRQAYQTASSSSSEKIEAWLDENMADIALSIEIERRTLAKQ